MGIIICGSPLAISLLCQLAVNGRLWANNNTLKMVLPLYCNKATWLQNKNNVRFCCIWTCWTYTLSGHWRGVACVRAWRWKINLNFPLAFTATPKMLWFGREKYDAYEAVKYILSLTKLPGSPWILHGQSLTSYWVSSIHHIICSGNCFSCLFTDAWFIWNNCS